MSKEIFIVRNQISLQAAILDCSGAAVHSHPFPKIYPENTGGKVLFLVKLLTDCSVQFRNRDYRPVGTKL